MGEGTIIAGVSSFYDVYQQGTVTRCKARGLFRKENITPVIGDRVRFSEQGYLEEILPRKNQLLRPAAANVDKVVIVFAVKNPNPHYPLLDRFLVESAQQSIQAVICLNKWDLKEDDQADEMSAVYESAGYPVIHTSAYGREGIGELRQMLEGKVTVFTGPSGVGKSSLLNAVDSRLVLQTGQLSEKVQRGRNTTRHAKLIPLDSGNGFVADTPGFTSLHLEHIPYADLGQYYPEFLPWLGNCRFTGCSHISEPDCGVKLGVQRGEISEQRYDSYAELYQEIRCQQESNRWK